ncbi:STAS domain-containing protein [Nonomuraea sp. NPDC002799]
MKLHLSASVRPHTTVIDVSGEVDLATAPDLNEFLVTIMKQRGPHLTLRLAEVSFIDSTGASALVHACHVARSRGGDLVVATLSRPVALVLSVCAIDHVLTLTADAAAACCAERPLLGSS